MQDDETPVDRSAVIPARVNSARVEREAAALRANLRKRKQQSQARAVQAEAKPPPDEDRPAEE